MVINLVCVAVAKKKEGLKEHGLQICQHYVCLLSLLNIEQSGLLEELYRVQVQTQAVYTRTHQEMR